MPLIFMGKAESVTQLMNKCGFGHAPRIKSGVMITCSSHAYLGIPTVNVVVFFNHYVWLSCVSTPALKSDTGLCMKLAQRRFELQYFSSFTTSKKSFIPISLIKIIVQPIFYNASRPKTNTWPLIGWWITLKGFFMASYGSSSISVSHLNFAIVNHTGTMHKNKKVETRSDLFILIWWKKIVITGRSKCWE